MLMVVLLTAETPADDGPPRSDEAADSSSSRSKDKDKSKPLETSRPPTTEFHRRPAPIDIPVLLERLSQWASQAESRRSDRSLDPGGDRA